MIFSYAVPLFFFRAEAPVNLLKALVFLNRLSSENFFIFRPLLAVATW